MEFILHLAAALLVAYLAGRLFERIYLTRILGYILAGVLLGPSVLNWFTEAMCLSLETLVLFALTFIAFLIGMKLRINELKKMERQIFEVTFFQAFLTFFSVAFFTFIFMQSFGFGHALSTSIILGAIAMATAPATVFALVDEYRARGPLTTLLLAVVAIDDAIAIFIYTLVMIFAAFLIEGASVPIASVLVFSLMDLLLPVVFGLALAGLFILLAKKVKDQVVCGVSLILLLLFLIFITERFQVPTLIAAMILGFIAVNFSGLTESTTEEVSRTEDLVFIFFFVTAGASLRIDILLSVGLIAIVYVLARWAGKVLGGSLGARLSGAGKKVQRWLGWGLLPQAGVAIAFVHMTAVMVPQLAEGITAIVLASIVLDEIIGPLGVELALFRSGEARRG